MFVPLVAASSLFLVLWTVAYLRAVVSLEGGIDLALARQAAWLISHGEAAHLSILGAHLLGDHASFAFYPMAWATRILPDVPTLLAFQSGALAVAVVPLYGIARRVAGLSPGRASFLLLLYALYPAIHNINLADFHLDALAVPGLLAAFLYGWERRWVPYSAALVVLLATKEDFGLLVAGLGVLLLLERRVKEGLVALFCGPLWTLFALNAVLKPRYGGTYRHAGEFGEYGSGPGEIVLGILSDLGQAFGDLWAGQKPLTLLALLAPVLLLPLLSPRYLVPGLPSLGVNFLSSKVMAHSVLFHYTAGVTGAVFVAAAMGLKRLDAKWVTRPLVVALLVLLLAFQGVWGLTIPASGEPAWSPPDPVDVARREAASLVQPGAALSASDRMLPLVADRRHAYRFPEPFSGYRMSVEAGPTVEERRDAVRYLLIDTADPVQWAGWQAELERRVAQGGFREVFSQRGILVFRR